MGKWKLSLSSLLKELIFMFYVIELQCLVGFIIRSLIYIANFYVHKNIFSWQNRILVWIYLNLILYWKAKVEATISSRKNNLERCHIQILRQSILYKTDKRDELYASFFVHVVIIHKKYRLLRIYDSIW